MSPTLRRNLLLTATLVMAGLALSACGGGFPGPVPIDEALWEIDLDGCGPTDTNPLQWAQGTVTNTSNVESTFYQTASKATFTDGTIGELTSGTLIPPLEPGQTFDFRFSLANSADKEVVTCEVWIVDSVSNYN